jgi:sugar/nucleoside kinase (ribokinase family)
VSRVVCLGLATRDTILAVPRRPERDELVVATDVAVAGGGPAATAAVTLARLGVEVSFVGAVGDDDVGAFARESLAADGVDLSELVVVSGGRSPQSAILVEPDGARTITAFRGELPPLAPSARALRLCREASWVHVDQTGYPATPRDVRLSIDGGNPIDGLDLAGVALYAPTETRLRETYGDAQAALDAGAELVVVTRGVGGSAAYARNGRIVEAPAHPVEPVSTLGAGDVFHGALLAALLREEPLAEALAFANACAALSCRALDGRSAIPTLEEVSA